MKNLKFYKLILFILLTNISCGSKDEGASLNSNTGLVTFGFFDDAVNQYKFTIDEASLTIQNAVPLPYKTPVNQLRAVFTTVNTLVKVKVNSVLQVNRTTVNDFSSPVKYDAYAEDGTKKTYTVIVNVSQVDPIVVVSDPPTVIPGYELDWNDEFNVTGKPDVTKWLPETGFVRNNELQWYQLENANCANGVLLIEGKRERIKNPYYLISGSDWAKSREYAEYSSASMTTRNKHAFLYGRFEIRAKIPVSNGLWPAIWTIGNDYGWPTSGEIDILEFYRPKPSLTPTIFANFCWGDAWNTQIWNSKTTPLTYFLGKDPNWADKFHVWRMDWDAEKIDLYLDDELLNTNSSTVYNQDQIIQPFLSTNNNHTVHLILNLAIGEGGGDPSATPFPQKYEIDYVRHYTKK